MGVIYYEPGSYDELEAMEEFQACKQKFFDEGWHDFFHSLQGHDDLVSFNLAMGFDGIMDHLGYLTFEVLKVTVAQVTKFPRTWVRWTKNTKVSKEDFKVFLKHEYTTVDASKGYPKIWLKTNYRKLLTFI